MPTNRADYQRGYSKGYRGDMTDTAWDDEIAKALIRTKRRRARNRAAGLNSNGRPYQSVAGARRYGELPHPGCTGRCLAVEGDLVCSCGYVG